MKRLPAEVVASMLAAITVLIALPPYHLPPVGHLHQLGRNVRGGRPEAGGAAPDLAGHAGRLHLCAGDRLLAFDVASQLPYAALGFTAAQMAIIFSLNTCLMYTGRIPLFSFIPGMFFGFASFFATFFGNFGPDPGNPFIAWIATVSMTMLGPAFAWLTAQVRGASRPRLTL